jgi:hypothetical protein
VPRYTRTDLKNAQTKRQLAGWLQRAGVTFVLLIIVC